MPVFDRVEALINVERCAEDNAGKLADLVARLIASRARRIVFRVNDFTSCLDMIRPVVQRFMYASFEVVGPAHDVNADRVINFDGGEGGG